MIQIDLKILKLERLITRVDALEIALEKKALLLKSDIAKEQVLNEK